MNNQENSIIISMLQNMQQDITEMKQSIIQTNKRIDSLEEKFDEKLVALDEKFESRFNYLENKFDSKFDALEKKVDNNSANIIRILNTISIMQKDIAYLRDDVETVYSLEKDSRKHLKLS